MRCGWLYMFQISRSCCATFLSGMIVSQYIIYQGPVSFQECFRNRNFYYQDKTAMRPSYAYISKTEISYWTSSRSANVDDTALKHFSVCMDHIAVSSSHTHTNTHTHTHTHPPTHTHTHTHIYNDLISYKNGNIFRVTGHLCGVFNIRWWIPCTKASDAELCCFFDLGLRKRFSKQSWGWWFETLSHSLCRHYIVCIIGLTFKWLIKTFSNSLLIVLVFTSNPPFIIPDSDPT